MKSNDKLEVEVAVMKAEVEVGVVGCGDMWEATKNPRTHRQCRR